ncbi:ABC transporter permease [Fibrivirga algicola]|uniref:FtsX-like permease family protein n=1 Tax=Fibrivirga algicola TaxID=2950420 RepID=A0ABX0QBG5_9BACT|nr:ABC transporter permease [Fibrivirga algicola]NID09680.1 FtsX-like permease family protein [Fibrivirga algicola]
MFSNTLKLAWRNLKAGGWYSVLNVGGLAVVLAVSVLLLWWVNDELRYDRFHPAADRIYRVNSRHGTGADEQFWRSAPAPIAVAASNNVPGIEAVTRVAGLYDFKTFLIDGKTFSEKGEDLVYVDENFLNVLGGFRVRYGQAKQPFPTPNSVVLTEDIAKKYFGTPNAVGKPITVIDSNRVFTVGAVVANLPDYSTFQKKIMFPMALRKRLFGGNGQWKRMDDDWGNFSFSTYVKLAPGVDPVTIGKTLTAIQSAARRKDGVGELGDYRLQPLSTIHLYEPDGTNPGMQQVRMMGLIALFLLSIGCINYVNLTTARATRRAREVGVRKVVGAETGHLMAQLLVESLLTLGLALGLAIGLIQVLGPFYRDMTGKTNGLSLLDPQVWLLMLGTLLVTLLLAGGYPALVIARFDPLKSLRGRGASGGQARLRQVLVVTQFALATGLIISTLVIGNQLRFMRERDLGFNKDHTFTFYADAKSQQFKRELAGESSIKSVATATVELTNGMGSTSDTEWDGKTPGRTFMVNQMSVSADFIPNMGMKLVEGQNFTGTPADSTNLILNETAVRESGITNPIGKRFNFHGTDCRIIGVVKDFVFESARNKVAPTVLMSIPNWNGTVYVRTSGQNTSQAIAAVEQLWKKIYPQYPFEYAFLDENYNRLYRDEQRTGNLFIFFAGVAIVICCLGLFGLAAYTAEQRTKEIGVRKVLGASVPSLIGLLSKDFLALVAVGILLAAPIAWWAMGNWLQGFIYRIDLQWWMVALAGLLAVGIALLTVSFQSIKAALMNPVESLRSE